MNTKDYQMACGTIAGREHTRLGKNNHDAYSVQTNSGAITAVVCDGCGSGGHSEMGAKLGARLLTEAIMANVHRHNNLQNIAPDFDWDYFWERIRQDVLAQLRILAVGMGQSLSQTVTDYFLFSTVGFLISQERTHVFSIGDGVYAVNGQVQVIGPFPHNAPPYLAYGLIRSSVGDTNPELIRIKIEKVLPTVDLDSILIGTDGVNHLINASQMKIPGRKDFVGPLEQFWLNDVYFANPENVNRRLLLVTREVVLPNWEEKIVTRECGYLLDDTTMVVLRKKISSQKTEISRSVAQKEARPVNKSGIFGFFKV